MLFKYPAFMEQYGDEYLVRFHDLPETFASGPDEEEAIFNATEALTSALMEYIDYGQDIPHPTPDIEGAVYIAPSYGVQSAMRLRFGSGASVQQAMPAMTQFHPS